MCQVIVNDVVVIRRNAYTYLRWETHTEYIISKAASRLYFLKQLERAGNW